ncbi:acyltransferase [Mitsuaria sp. WAJ17]|uniref:acyltransferase family protein n=1 Tax=Mitsuaria sp. WAJ17 TaxID=2761452 RepID=UPI0016002790|nr:acyltransferase [Mitsuaria sp. WAJ17]MBB2487017.1 acyltransferase [Mitsuaria sp. WAJ17]
MSPAFSIHLDLLRLAAALLVFVHHASYARFHGRWLQGLAGYGHEAVVVFFVLSGYVIAYNHEHKDLDWRRYAVQRLSRLWSVALPAIALTLLLDAWGRPLQPTLHDTQPGGWGRVLASVLFVNEFWIEGWAAGSNIPLWSLSYEAGYYLLFGVLSFSPARWRWPLTLACALLIGPRLLLLLPAWWLGVWVHRSRRVQAMGASEGALLAAIGLAWALALAVGKVGNRFITWRLMDLLSQPLSQLIGNSDAFISDNLIALGVAAHVAGMSAWLRGRQAPAALARWAARLSRATFPIYLFHYPLLQFFAALTTVWPLLAWGGVAVLSLILSAAFTGPCEQLRQVLRRWLSRRLQTAGRPWP